MGTKPRIGIVRGHMPRVSQADISLGFHKLDPKFITAGANDDLITYLKVSNIPYSSFDQKPIYAFDPFRLIGKSNHRSWVGFNKDDLEKEIKTCDVVETYETFHFFSAQSADICSKLHIPLVTEIWTTFWHPSYVIPPYSLNVAKVKRATSLFILRSNNAYNYIKHLKVPKDKVRMIYHGIDLERFNHKNSKDDLLVNILFVGTLLYAKGIDAVLDAFTRLYDKYPFVRLTVCGKGEYESKLGDIKGVKYLGSVPSSKMPEIYAKADIFCAPSRPWKYFGLFPASEMFGYVYMEAMASGLPIVSSKVGSIPEVLGSKNLLVNEVNAQKVYKALEKLILNKSFRNEIGMSNLNRAKELFDVRKQSRVLEDAILDIL